MSISRPHLLLLDVVRMAELRAGPDSQLHLGHAPGGVAGGKGVRGHLLRDGPPGRRVLPAAGSTPSRCRKWGCMHRLFLTRLPSGARLADTQLRPEAHSSILALRYAIG